MLKTVWFMFVLLSQNLKVPLPETLATELGKKLNDKMLIIFLFIYLF